MAPYLLDGFGIFIHKPKQHMDKVDDYCQRTLELLKLNKDQFLRASFILEDLDIPENELPNIMYCLGKNEHVEFRTHHYKPSDMKITAKGLELLDGLGYKGIAGINSDIKRHRVMIVDVDNSKTKEKLEFRQLRLTIQSLELSLQDYPKVRKEARVAIICAVCSALLALIAIVLK
jgi:hypothetical protein